MDTGHTHDLLIIGAGPAGACAAYWAARAGLDVVAIDRAAFPRDKTCGDLIGPRAVAQLDDMGLGARLTDHHRITKLRAVAHGKATELDWPSHQRFPGYGYTVRRRDLDALVANRASDAGADVRFGVEAVRPVFDNGILAGAAVRSLGDDATVISGSDAEIRARYLVIADGAGSPFGRDLGTWRNRAYPQGVAIRGYYESPSHDSTVAESVFDVRDHLDTHVPGYGWIFPVGDGTVNVGIGLLSTFRDYTSVDTTALLESFANNVAGRWDIDPASPVVAPSGGRLPMAGSVGPKVGPTFIVVGDAAGTVNPFNGEGVDYAYETGRKATELVIQALGTDNGLVLQRYNTWLETEFGAYFKVARLFARVVGNPQMARGVTRVAMQSDTALEWSMRIMTNLLRDTDGGPPEALFSALERLSRMVPEPAQG
jgi:geranylgeranyl reductase family protein